MKTFKEIFEATYGEGSFNDEFTINALSAQGLAEAFAKESQEWIAAFDRLPECGKLVLLLFWDKVQTSIGFYDNINNRWQTDGSYHFDDYTHWMPLPSSPVL